MTTITSWASGDAKNRTDFPHKSTCRKGSRTRTLELVCKERSQWQRYAEVRNDPFFRLFSLPKPLFLVILPKTVFYSLFPAYSVQTRLFLCEENCCVFCVHLQHFPSSTSASRKGKPSQRKLKIKEEATFLENIHAYNSHNYSTCGWVLCFMISKNSKKRCVHVLNMFFCSQSDWFGIFAVEWRRKVGFAWKEIETRRSGQHFTADTNNILNCWIHKYKFTNSQIQWRSGQHFTADTNNIIDC